MVLQVIAGVAWLVWLSSGTAGLKESITVGAFLIIGIGIKNLLDTFWKKNSEEKSKRKESDEDDTPRWAPVAKKRVNLPSSNWNLPRMSVSRNYSSLPRVGEK